MEEECDAEDESREEIRPNRQTGSSEMLESEPFVEGLESKSTECEGVAMNGRSFKDNEEEEEGPSSDVLEPMSTEGEDMPIERSFEDKKPSTIYSANLWL